MRSRLAWRVGIGLGALVGAGDGDGSAVSLASAAEPSAELDANGPIWHAAEAAAPAVSASSFLRPMDRGYCLD